MTISGLGRVPVLLAGCVLAGVLSNDAAVAAAVKPLHPGPAVWIEEYWDVKPEKLDEFVQTYRREVYSITRRIPGYRGYTVITNVPDAQGNPRGYAGEPDELLTKHYGIRLQGRILTERAVDIGKMLRHTHNVVIAHHLQSWPDADAFRRCVADTFAAEHPGRTLGDHLAQTLSPLANNFWETSFRLAATGIPAEPAEGPRGADADGLDLEPRASDTPWFKEYFDVRPTDLEAFIRTYEANTYHVMSQIPGYRGVSIVTSVPPDSVEAKRTAYAGQALGGSRDFFVPQPGVMMDGAVRTDMSVNYSSLFRDTFSVITYFQLPPNTQMMQEMQQIYERDHPGQNRVEHINKVFFPLAQNHWDMWYRGIETSFVPLTAPPPGGVAGCPATR